MKKLFIGFSSFLLLSNCTLSGARSIPAGVVDFEDINANQALHNRIQPEQKGINLVPDSILTNNERDLRAFQRRSLALKFPIKVGIVFIDHQSNFKAEEKQAAFTTMKKSMEDSGLVKEFTEIPANLLSGGSNVDKIRLLGSRFQLDVVAILTGKQVFEKAEEQNLGFFDQFNNKRAWESRSRLQAILLNIFSGTFLSSLSSTGKSGPEILDQEDLDFNANKHKLQKESEENSWQAMTEKLQGSLRKTQENLAKNPEPELDLSGNEVKK